jgi:hypothetical protein
MGKIEQMRALQIPRAFSGVLCSPLFDITDTFSIIFFIRRRGSLDHSHEASADARECGRLTCGFYTFTTSPSSDTTAHTISTGPAAKDRHWLMPRVFSSKIAGVEYGYDHWNDIKHKHDMAVPRDEWRISIMGVVDAHIAIERVFYDEHDSDYDDLNEDNSHRFTDVIDIVIRQNTQLDSAVTDISQDEVECLATGYNIK